jgi:molybdopterin-containing oxidoreductase family iron-sulfur binding subunit
MDRRRFLKVMGVTGGGAAALSGCGPDNAQKLIPYLVNPDNQIPGLATYYASTCRECPGGCGIHVRVREGRAVKVEGNPESPINHGSLCARGQASLQGLYNPDRIQSPMARNGSGGFDPISWDDAIARVAQQVGGAGANRVAFLTGSETGTFDQLVNDWLAAVGSPNGRVIFEPFGYESLRFANRQVFGLDTIPHYRFDNADYVLSLGADFLETWVSPVEFTGQFAQRHAFQNGRMGRYVHVEPRMSMTAFSADEWIAPVPGTEGVLALAIARVVLEDHGGNAPPDASQVRGVLTALDVATAAQQTGVDEATIRRLAGEFAAGPSIAVAGGIGAQHAGAHQTAAAVNILNYVAGNVGQTVIFGPNVAVGGGSTYQGLADFLGSVQNIGVVLMHGANPAYATPPAMGVADAIGRVPFKVSFARFMDETAWLADLILPDHDPLEQWNDSVPRVGVHALQQPVMRPIFDTRQTGDVLFQLVQALGGTAAGRLTQATYKDYLQDRWRQLQQRLGATGSFDDFWNQSLQSGGAHEPPEPQTVRLVSSAGQVQVAAQGTAGDGLTLIAYPSSVFFDGRGANRPWLQELPDPVAKISWSTWVEIHPDTAQELGVGDGDILQITTAAGSVEAPAYLYPGIRPDVVAMPIGQGHTAFGRYAEGRGANAFHLLAGDAAAFGGLVHYAAAQVTPTGAYERLASSAGKSRQMGRGISQSTTLHDIEEGDFHTFHVEHAAEVPEHIEPVLEEWQRAQTEETKRGNYAGEHPRWGMSVDLSRCTGCSACITACYAENNIATVGKDQVTRGREMTWIRIERYFEGGEDGEPLRVELLPMMCQQCGRAPCEPVCPVFAAYHTPDGLNGQVYNRCVGTRYCMNNCPYKVRYFNWYDHGNPNDQALSWPDPLHMLLNPDVVVRSKGVMEKCTFCVQRIRGAQNEARLQRRELRDGEVRTACQQTCPADAIVFGDLNDPESEVSRVAQSELGYHVLEGLNTDPGVTYLTRVRNTVEA